MQALKPMAARIAVILRMRKDVVLLLNLCLFHTGGRLKAGLQPRLAAPH